MNNILRTERLIDMKQTSLESFHVMHRNKQTNLFWPMPAVFFVFILFFFFFNQFAQNPGVLNFELGPDVRPEVSTTTL